MSGFGASHRIIAELLRARTDLTVIATASRPETPARYWFWVIFSERW